MKLSNLINKVANKLSNKEIEEKLNEILKKNIEGSLGSWGIEDKKPGYISSDEYTITTLPGSSVMKKIKDAFRGTEAEKYIDLKKGYKAYFDYNFPLISEKKALYYGKENLNMDKALLLDHLPKYSDGVSRRLKISEKLIALIIQAVKMSGLDPTSNMAYIGEELTNEEYDTTQAFLNWCLDENKRFGRGNIKQVWKEFQDEMERINSK